MRNRKKNTILISLLILPFALFNNCQIAKDRPVLKVPDGNRDRMLKETFSGTDADPKYWIYKVTVVDTSRNTDFIFKGVQSQVKLGYFEFAREKLKFYNSVTRRSLEDPDTASQVLPELINQWDIRHSEFRLAEVDGYTTNREEENNYIPWRQKQYFTIDWSKANIEEATTFPYFIGIRSKRCWSKTATELIDSSREITENYISFVVGVIYKWNEGEGCLTLSRRHRGDLTSTVRYKYSFKKVPDPRSENPGYSPYVYRGENDPLMRKYGYFNTVRPAIAPDNRDQNVFYMNRWNPNKKHIFYFSRDYPEEYKDIAHGLICHTNKLFANHELNDYPLDGRCREDGSVLPGKEETCTTGICFELRENQGQELGDIRYSFFHIGNTNILPVLGYGPSDAHPATGEILSGNVILSTYGLDFYLSQLQSLYQRDLGEQYDSDGRLIKVNGTKYENSPLFVRMKETLDQDDHTLWTETSKEIDRDSDIRPHFEYLISQLTYGHPLSSPFTTVPNAYETNIFVNEQILSELLPQQKARKIKKDIQEIPQFVEQFQKNLMEQLNHEKNTVIYPVEPIAAQIPSMLINGMSPEEIKRRILFSVMSHEFGHVLNLRHNFYGSFDAGNWDTEGNGRPLLKTSSVMDYLVLKDEAEGPLRALFGSYDEAALVYAYSGGEKDLSKEKNTHYLFCTEHHVPLNFFCNPFDYGETPSQIMMGLIEQYEERYIIHNLRLDRAYWDTRFYPFHMLGVMLNFKQILPIWVTDVADGTVSRILSEFARGDTGEQIRAASGRIQDDIRQAIRLSLAFYDSVLHLDSERRPWATKFDREGSTERIGIFWDKIFAVKFLIQGTSMLSYNPSQFIEEVSYLTYKDSLDRQMIEKIIENLMTARVDMQPDFIYYVRTLYAVSSAEDNNIVVDDNLLERIGIRCYTARGLKNRFGIDPYNYQANENSPPGILNTEVVPMELYLNEINDLYYRNTNEHLGITLYDNNYYVAASNKNQYSFAMIERMKENNLTLNIEKRDFYEMFLLYKSLKRDPTNIHDCDNGD